MARSMNGYWFTASPNSLGNMVTVVAGKNDHEAQHTVVFTFSTDAIAQLISLLKGTAETAKRRRKAIAKESKTTA